MPLKRKKVLSLHSFIKQKNNKIQANELSFIYSTKDKRQRGQR